MSRIEERLAALEKALPSGEVLTPDEMNKWFLMFMEKRGTGHATYKGQTERKEYTPEDWTWYEETTAKMGLEAK